MIPVLLAALLLPCAGPGRQTPDTFELEPFRWRAEATPQPAISAANEWGDLRVRTTARDTLEVSAMIQNIGGRPEFEVMVDEREDRVDVRVRPLVASPRGRVDLTLLVPAGKQVDASTRDGLAEVKHSGPVRAHTRAGAIVIDTPSHAAARSEAGSITAKLSGGGWRDPTALSTGSGAIVVWLPRDAGVELRAEAGGGVEVGFPLRPGAGHTPSRVRARIGRGGPELHVESGTGAVSVLPYGGGSPSAP